MATTEIVELRWTHAETLRGMRQEAAVKMHQASKMGAHDAAKVYADRVAALDYALHISSLVEQLEAGSLS